MMYLPTYAEALELKKYAADRNLVYIHFHDQCGSQFFSLDRDDEKTKKAVMEFWNQKGLNVSFAEDGITFIVLEK